MMKDTLLSKLKSDLASAKSYDNYIVRITKLEELIGKSIDYIMIHPNEVYPRIKDKYPNINTRKNLLTPILSLYRVNPEFAGTEDGKKGKEGWKKYHDDMNILQSVQSKKNKIPEKMKKNYVSTEEVELKVRELKKEEDPHNNLENSQQFLLLTLLTDIKPKRSDLGSMKIYRNTDPHKKDENYLVLRDKISDPSYMVYQVYKTKKYFGRVEEDLSGDSIRVLKQSLRRYPREYVFIDKFRRPFQSNDSYGKFVKRTFETKFGRELGTSLWRHVYIIEKVSGADVRDEDKDDIARLMLHSKKMNDQYRWVTRGNQMCYCENK